MKTTPVHWLAGKTAALMIGILENINELTNAALVYSSKYPQTGIISLVILFFGLLSGHAGFIQRE